VLTLIHFNADVTKKAKIFFPHILLIIELKERGLEIKVTVSQDPLLPRKLSPGCVACLLLPP
jgi:hypothetical protein